MMAREYGFVLANRFGAYLITKKHRASLAFANDALSAFWFLFGFQSKQWEARLPPHSRFALGGEPLASSARKRAAVLIT